MDKEEVLRILRELLKINRFIAIEKLKHKETQQVIERCAALDQAIIVIDKQIHPKSVYCIADGEADGSPVYDMAVCPYCEQTFEDGDSNWENADFCPNCGGAIKWDFELEDEEGDE